MKDLDTITQLFAAIYITLAVDIQFFQRFWSQTYYHTVTKIIDKYNFNKSTKFQQELLSDIEQQAVSLETSSRKRGFLMFCFCLIVLIYATFEIPTDIDNTHDYIRVIIFSLFTLIVALTSHSLLKSWLHLLVIGVILLCLLLIPYQEMIIKCAPYIQNITTIKLTKIIIIFTLGIPISWQLFSNWLYSTIYKKYLVKLLNKEARDYKATIKAKREKDGSILPRSYTDVIATWQIEGETNEDVQITGINNVLSKRLKAACKYPSSWTLLKNICQKDEDILSLNEEELKNKLDYNESVNSNSLISNSSQNQSNIKSTELCKSKPQQIQKTNRKNLQKKQNIRFKH